MNNADISSAAGVNVSGVVAIGSYRGISYYFNGLIDEVRIYSEALASAQIKKLYAEGAEKRGLLSEK